MFSVGTPGKAPTFASILPKNRPADLTVHPERPGHRTLASATTWLFLERGAPSVAHFRFTRYGRIMATPRPRQWPLARRAADLGKVVAVGRSYLTE